MIESSAEGSTPTPAPETAAPPAVIRPAQPVRRPWVRQLGNALILLGLLLMVGVGGYLGIQTYTNNQIAQQINDQHQQTEGLNVLPPEPPAATDPQAPAGGSGAAAPAAAPAAVPANDTVRVDEAPLIQLNNVALGRNLVALAPVTKPPVRIEIPAVGILCPVVPVGWEMIPGKDGQDSSQWKVAEYAAGHHQGSANPGQIGNVVISGHVDWKGEVFKNLHNAKRGDEIHIYTDDREFLYIVQDVVLVKEDGVPDAQKRENARYMDPTPDQTLTLITCFPYGIDDHRLIVIAKPYDSGLAARPDLTVK